MRQKSHPTKAGTNALPLTTGGTVRSGIVRGGMVCGGYRCRMDGLVRGMVFIAGVVQLRISTDLPPTEPTPSNYEFDSWEGP